MRKVAVTGGSEIRVRARTLEERQQLALLGRRQQDRIVGHAARAIRRAERCAELREAALPYGRLWQPIIVSWVCGAKGYWKSPPTPDHRHPTTAAAVVGVVVVVHGMVPVPAAVATAAVAATHPICVFLSAGGGTAPASGCGRVCVCGGERTGRCRRLGKCSQRTPPHVASARQAAKPDSCSRATSFCSKASARSRDAKCAVEQHLPCVQPRLSMLAPAASVSATAALQ